MALTITSTDVFIPQSEKGNESPLTFHVKKLTSGKRRSVLHTQQAVQHKYDPKDYEGEEGYYSAIGLDPDLGAMVDALVSSQVAKIENLVIDGVKIDSGKALLENDLLPEEIKTELFQFIMAGSSVSQDEEKN